MSDLLKRIGSALVAAPVFLYLIWLGGWYFVVTLVIIAAIIQLEIIRMIEKKGMEVQKTMAVILGIPVLLVSVLPESAWIFFLMFLLLTMLIETFGKSRDGWKRLATTLMVAVLIPALISGLLILRNFKDDSTGFILALTLLLMVWSNDIFSFFGGKAMGRKPLAPEISPAKTVEGFFFGFAGSFAALFLCHFFIPGFPLDYSVSIPFAIIAGLFGPAGDLAESKLKRAFCIKDSSALIPGHGGLYDRFDALLFSAPASAIYFFVLDLVANL